MRTATRRVCASVPALKTQKSRQNLLKMHPSLCRFCCAMSNDLQSVKTTGQRYAILGAGFAGVALSWNLLKNASAKSGISIDIIDKSGVGSGASGVSGGLLHPYSPKGKLLWHGLEAWNDALLLLKETESLENCGSNDSLETSVIRSNISWKRGILRPATEKKHVDDFKKNVPVIEDEVFFGRKVEEISAISFKASETLIPGISPCEGSSLYIPKGITIHSRRYLEALFRACQNRVNSLNSENGAETSHFELVLEEINSLSQLSDRGYDAVCVCLGPGASKLKDFKNPLPLKLARGKILELLAVEKGIEQKFPSIVGKTWMAVQDEGNILVGATKEEGQGDENPQVLMEELESACGALLPSITNVYPPLLSKYNVIGARAGVRAIPSRTALGALPLTGCIDSLLAESLPFKSWIIGGLGSRGLIYHGWLARMTSECMARGTEEGLPEALLEWKSQKVPKSSRSRRRKKTDE